MPKILTEAEVGQFERDGFVGPFRVLTDAQVRAYRQKLESFETRHPTEVKKLKTKSHLLCPWVLEIAENPGILDVFEDLIGPDILCWSMAWRIKKPDGETMAGWHQDAAYGSPTPIIIGALALADCGPSQGCLRGIPGSHRWGILKHEESDDPKSILARGQYITDPFDEGAAVDFALRPGEMTLFDTRLVHGSGPNRGPDRRIMLLVEHMPTTARMERFRESAMLLRGVDRFGNFDPEPRPDGEFTEAAVAAWKRVVDARAARLFDGSRYGPSEAYGGGRPAT